MLEDLQHLIPAELLGRSGATFNVGRAAFTQPSALYLLGLNPGGDPAKHQHETVASHLAAVLNKPADWAAFRDDSWNGRPPGTTGMQPRVVHLLKRLGLDAHQVPTSNLIFERTRSAEKLSARIHELAEACWPVHAQVIERLKVRVILCFGQDAGKWVRTRLGASDLVGTFVEQNERRWTSTAHASSAGMTVVTATHPAIASWRHAATDPTPLVQSMLERA